MKQIRSVRGVALALILATGAFAVPASGQTGFIAPSVPEADQLAQEMRVLAADPRNVRALLEAGNLSARLGDTAAALAFFARAETVDPSNPRILAGRGAALVRMARPGEALRLFQTAESRGLPAREYAADRGFAYDLLGQPLLAQSDYKVALRDARDDETVRRYALSLGIAGDVETAMRELDPLLRKSDRAAWRARAFILAMNGDMPGAERIAASMMPGNMGASLAPFFRRLANLSPADRAFAVHFGEISPSAARLADARQAPPLPRYVPAARPVQVAAVEQARASAVDARSKGKDRRSRRQRARDASVPPAVEPRAAPVEIAAAAPLPGPPTLAPRPQVPLVQPLPTPKAEELDAPVRQAAAPVRVASRDVTPRERTPIAPPSQGGPAAAAVGDTAPAPARVPTPTPARAPTPAPTPVPANNPIDTVAASQGQAATTLPESARPTQASALIQPAPAEAVTARAEPAPPGPARVGQEDSVLASIVAGITIPAEELQVVTATPVDPVPEPSTVAAATPEPAQPAPKPAPPKVTAKPKPEPAKVDVAKGKDLRKADPAKPDAAKGKDAKKADTAKPDPKAKKPDPKAKDPAKGEPTRIWVQVAGGANEASLPKAWKAVAAKAPAAFKGRSGWWTPLRATNRVLTGPFKTASEAQVFVNTLGKSGVSAFVFNSEAGQKVTRLVAD